MRNVNNIFDQLILDEDCPLKVYRDNSTRVGFEGKQGKLTIGVGRNLEDRGITRAEAMYMLQTDITEWKNALVQALPWSTQLSEIRFGVLINMAHNLGVPGLLGFKRALAAMQNQDWETAAAEMEDSTWATQVGPRAHRLAEQIRKNEWQ